MSGGIAPHGTVLTVCALFGWRRRRVCFDTPRRVVVPEVETLPAGFRMSLSLIDASAGVDMAVRNSLDVCGNGCVRAL